MTKNLREAEDNSLGAIMYQGKPLSQWEKEFKGEFSIEQLFQLIRSGIDIGRIKFGIVDEDDDIDDKALFKDEQFFFNEDENRSIKDYVMPNVEIRVFTVDTGKEVYASRVEPDEIDVSVAPYIARIGSDKNNDGFARQLLPTGKQSIKEPLQAYIYVDGAPLSTEFDELEKQIKDLQARVARVKRNTMKFKDIVKEDDDIRSFEDIAESTRQPEDVVTVEDFIELLRRRAKLTDKIMFRVYKKNGMLLDINSRGGTAVVDIVPAMDENEKVNESITPEQWEEAAAWFNANGYEIEDDEARLEKIAPQMDDFLFKVGMSPTSKDEVVKGQDGYNLYMSMKENKQMNEGRSWYGGGYGGTGRSWKSLGGKGPRGAEIGWFSVGELDPKAKGKMPGWRCGPSNFPFKDLFFPNRKYKTGTMVMRNKYVKAGDLSGVLYIAIPSYFEIVKSGNKEGIEVLKNLGIPLDLTFGMDPDDDYSVTYTEIN